MKKITYLLLFGLLACSGNNVDPQPVKDSIPSPDQVIPRVTCFYDSWALLHNAPAGIIPFGTTITYNVTPTNPIGHNILQYTIKVKNLGTTAINCTGTLTPPPSFRLGPGQSYTGTHSFSDCSHGTTTDYFTCFPSITGQPMTNVVVTLTTVSASHTL